MKIGRFQYPASQAGRVTVDGVGGVAIVEAMRHGQGDLCTHTLTEGMAITHGVLAVGNLALAAGVGRSQKGGQAPVTGYRLAVALSDAMTGLGFGLTTHMGSRLGLMFSGLGMAFSTALQFNPPGEERS